MEESPFEEGESAIAIPVPAVEPLVSAWRDRLDSSAAYGIPAHITVLYPFLQASFLTGAVLERLREQFCASEPLEVTFEEPRRFTGVLYLAPEPAAVLARLIHRFARRWPETPPYGGRHNQVVPHLTVAEGPDEVLDTVESALRPGLPLTTRLELASLYVFENGRFQVREQLPLGALAARD